MSDAAKFLLTLGVVAGIFYLATRGKKTKSSAWQVFPTAAEPDGTGVNFNPAFVSTAASPDPVFTGEPETGNGGGCVPKKRKGCGGCGGC
jgi:hypothetical protein